MKALLTYLKAYWRLLALFISVVLGFTILVQVFKEPRLPVYIPWYEQIAVYVFDWVNDWAVALSALVTFILAFAAFFSISDNRYFQRKQEELENKRHALKEIREWAQETITLLTQNINELPPSTQIKETFKLIKRRTLSALAAAQVVDEELSKKIRKTSETLIEFQDAADHNNNSFDYAPKFKDILDNLVTIMNATFQMW